jgi:uncharacterized protein HemY
LQFERPKAYEFFFNLGYCYFQAEKWDQAEGALKLAPAKEIEKRFSSAAHYYLGHLFHCKGAVAKALLEFKMAWNDATAAGTSRKVIYDALARSSQYLGLSEEASRYRLLAKSSN